MTDTVEYWRERAETAEQDLAELQEASEMVEKELEMELKQTQEKLKSIDNEYNQLRHNFEEKDERLSHELDLTQKNLSDLTREVEDLRSSEQFKTTLIRQLEHTVDNLENQKRNMLETIRDLEHKLADQLEETALLEADLEKKNDLATECQRLRDQARDLTSDLMAEKKTAEKIRNQLDEERVKSKNLSPPSAQISEKATILSMKNSSSILTSDSTTMDIDEAIPAISGSPLKRGSHRNSTFQDIRTDITNIQNSFHEDQQDDSIIEKKKLHRKMMGNSKGLNSFDSPNVSLEKQSTPISKELPFSQSPKPFKRTSISSKLKKLSSSNNSLASTKTTTSSRKNSTSELSSVSGPSTPTNQTRPKFLTPSISNRLNQQNKQTAVGLVGDLLTKIHALESKLTTCRQFIRESPWRNVDAKRQKRNDDMQVDSPKSSRKNSAISNTRKKSKVQGFQTAV